MSKSKSIEDAQSGWNEVMLMLVPFLKFKHKGINIKGGTKYAV